MSEPLSDRAMRKLLDLAAADDPPPGPALLPERYEVRGELGRGGMGVVYEAHDRQLDRLCAVKMIGAGAGADDDLRRRFLREALAAARLRHPHIAAIYDATADYISMQRVVGVPLDSIDPGERRLIVELVRDAARAVHHAHEQGIVHRDLKPSNMLVEGRHLFVVDFGLAKEIAADGSMSLSGAVVGTPAFMPPEQALGRSEAVDARSDVYALGATLHRCLTGRPPFADADLPSLLRSIVEDEPAPPRIERDLDLVVLKCLQKDPAQRYASAEELARDLDRWLRSEPVTARRPSLGYRLRKHLQRRGALLRAAGIAALAAVGVTALILVPMMLRESAGRVAASEAVALSSRAAAVLQDAALFNRLGDIRSAQEVLDRGVAEARSFLRRHDVPRVHHLLSRLLRARGQLPEALAELEAAIAGDPSLSEARFERGIMLAAQPGLEGAELRRTIADLSEPLGADPALSGVDRLFGRGELLRLQGSLGEAIELLREVLAYDPTHIGARLSLSLIAQEQGDPDTALNYAASAVNLQQGYGPVFFAREQRQLPTTIYGLEGALLDFAPVLADSPDDALAMAQRGLVQLRRALRLEHEGDLAAAAAAAEAAVGDYDVTLSIHTDLPGALNNRAVCLMEAQRLHARLGDGEAAAACRRRAEADLERVLGIAPDLVEGHFNRGLLNLRNAQLLRVLGRGTAAKGGFDAARSALQQALATAAPGWALERSCRELLLEAQRDG